jgi:hypothetical protein
MEKAVGAPDGRVFSVGKLWSANLPGWAWRRLCWMGEIFRSRQLQLYPLRISSQLQDFVHWPVGWTTPDFSHHLARTMHTASALHPHSEQASFYRGSRRTFFSTHGNHFCAPASRLKSRPNTVFRHLLPDEPMASFFPFTG